MKRVTATLLATILLLLLSVSAYAFSAKVHDNHLEIALFGPYGLQTSNEKARDMLDALKHASYLCIDQYNGDGHEMHLELLLELQKEYWVMFWPTRGHYPESIADINYNSNASHRAYTHLGWEVKYDQRYNKVKIADWLSDRWPKRQDLLRSTVEAVFNFNKWSLSINSTTGEEMCKLIYYVHILGDHIGFAEYETYAKEAKYICPLGGFSDETTILTELVKTLDNLFGTEASELIRKLQTIDKDLRSICHSDGTVSEADFPKYQEYTKKVLEALSEKLPALLKQQPYFSEVFY